MLRDRCFALVCLRSFVGLCRDYSHLLLLLLIDTPFRLPIVVASSLWLQVRLNSLLADLGLASCRKISQEPVLFVFIPNFVVALLAVNVSAHHFRLPFVFQSSKCIKSAKSGRVLRLTVAGTS